MDFSILTIIILVTVVFSYMAFNDKSLMDKTLYIPYDCKHNNNYSRIISHVFIHADYGHLLFNMFTLYFMGNSLLKYGFYPAYGSVMGQAHFFALYFLGGVFATLIPYVRNQDNPNYRSLGASGAVSAIVFASIIWHPTMELNIMFIPIPIKAYIFGPLYLLYEFYADKKGQSGIAHDAHIGGAIFGVLYVLIINIDKGKEFINAIF